jgi:hypothetical protein
MGQKFGITPDTVYTMPGVIDMKERKVGRFSTGIIGSGIQVDRLFLKVPNGTPNAPCTTDKVKKGGKGFVLRCQGPNKSFLRAIQRVKIPPASATGLQQTL